MAYSVKTILIVVLLQLALVNALPVERQKDPKKCSCTCPHDNDESKIVIYNEKLRDLLKNAGLLLPTGDDTTSPSSDAAEEEVATFSHFREGDELDTQQSDHVYVSTNRDAEGSQQPLGEGAKSNNNEEENSETQDKTLSQLNLEEYFRILEDNANEAPSEETERKGSTEDITKHEPSSINLDEIIESVFGSTESDSSSKWSEASDELSSNEERHSKDDTESKIRTTLTIDANINNYPKKKNENEYDHSEKLSDNDGVLENSYLADSESHVTTAPLPDWEKDSQEESSSEVEDSQEKSSSEEEDSRVTVKPIPDWEKDLQEESSSEEEDSHVIAKPIPDWDKDLQEESSSEEEDSQEESSSEVEDSQEESSSEEEDSHVIAKPIPDWDKDLQEESSSKEEDSQEESSSEVEDSQEESSSEEEDSHVIAKPIPDWDKDLQEESSSEEEDSQEESSSEVEDSQEESSSEEKDSHVTAKPIPDWEKDSQEETSSEEEDSHVLAKPNPDWEKDSQEESSSEEEYSHVATTPLPDWEIDSNEESSSEEEDSHVTAKPIPDWEKDSQEETSFVEEDPYVATTPLPDWEKDSQEESSSEEEDSHVATTPLPDWEKDSHEESSSGEEDSHVTAKPIPGWDKDSHEESSSEEDSSHVTAKQIPVWETDSQEESSSEEEDSHVTAKPIPGWDKDSHEESSSEEDSSHVTAKQIPVWETDSQEESSSEKEDSHVTAKQIPDWDKDSHEESSSEEENPYVATTPLPDWEKDSQEEGSSEEEDSHVTAKQIPDWDKDLQEESSSEEEDSHVVTRPIPDWEKDSHEESSTEEDLDILKSKDTVEGSGPVSNEPFSYHSSDWKHDTDKDISLYFLESNENVPPSDLSKSNAGSTQNQESETGFTDSSGPKDSDVSLSGQSNEEVIDELTEKDFDVEEEINLRISSDVPSNSFVETQLWIKNQDSSLENGENSTNGLEPRIQVPDSDTSQNEDELAWLEWWSGQTGIGSNDDDKETPTPPTEKEGEVTDKHLEYNYPPVEDTIKDNNAQTTGHELGYNYPHDNVYGWPSGTSGEVLTTDEETKHSFTQDYPEQPSLSFKDQPSKYFGKDCFDEDYVHGTVQELGVYNPHRNGYGWPSESDRDTSTPVWQKTNSFTEEYPENPSTAEDYDPGWFSNFWYPTKLISNYLPKSAGFIYNPYSSRTYSGSSANYIGARDQSIFDGSSHGNSGDPYDTELSTHPHKYILLHETNQFPTETFDVSRGHEYQEAGNYEMNVAGYHHGYQSPNSYHAGYHPEYSQSPNSNFASYRPRYSQSAISYVAGYHPAYNQLPRSYEPYTDYSQLHPYYADRGYGISPASDKITSVAWGPQSSQIHPTTSRPWNPYLYSSHPELFSGYYTPLQSGYTSLIFEGESKR